MNTTRLSLIILFFTAFASQLLAQEQAADSLSIIENIESAGAIKISVPDGFDKLLVKEGSTIFEEDEAEKAAQAKASSKVGYRIQVFDDNNVRTAKHEAQNRKRQMENRFPEYRAYTQFNSPYWRVKVGDFRTRSEAEAALAAIKAAYPGLSSQLRVVRDRINVIH